MTGWWQSAQVRFKDLLAEYGSIALGTYFVIFFGTWFGFWWAISSGIEVSGATGAAGTIGGAYAATKLTQPLRIGATVVLTPLVAAVKHRIWPSPEPSVPPPQDS